MKYECKPRLTTSDIFSEKNGHSKQDPNIDFIRIYSLFFTTNIVKKYQQITRDLFFS